MCDPRQSPDPPLPAPIRILIADDHDVVREGLAAILSRQPSLELVGVAQDGIEAVELAEALQPDVILLDLVMPRRDGLAAIRGIHEVHPNAHILVLTSFADDDNVFAAIKAGALGYVLKDARSAQLVEDIRSVAAGHAAIHPDVALKLMHEFQEPPPEAEAPVSLTRREGQTLRLLAQGLTNEEIATKLVIHQRTVAKYVSSILTKLHVANRTQAALYAVQEGLVDPE